MRIAVTVLIICVYGCSENRNETMTKLLNSRPPLEDSIKMAGLKSEGYMLEAERYKRAGVDSSIWHRFVDTSTQYDIKKVKLTRELKAVNFSIDSLSKMK